VVLGQNIPDLKTAGVNSVNLLFSMPVSDCFGRETVLCTTSIGLSDSMVLNLVAE
jgi:hypothetical protein